MIEQTIKVDRLEHVINVFGSFDQNLRIIETELGVKVLDRDEMIHICGEAEDVMLAEKAINGLLTLAAKGESIDAQNVRYIIKLVKEGRETKIGELAGDVGAKRRGQPFFCCGNKITLSVSFADSLRPEPEKTESSPS